MRYLFSETCSEISDGQRTAISYRHNSKKGVCAPEQDAAFQFCSHIFLVKPKCIWKIAEFCKLGLKSSQKLDVANLIVLPNIKEKSARVTFMRDTTLIEQSTLK